MENFGTRLKKFRETLGLSQEAFGEATAFARGTIAAYESGDRAQSDRLISIIELKFNGNPEWLRTGKGEMFLPVDIDSNDIETTKRVLIAKIAELPEDAQRAIADFCHALLEKIDKSDETPKNKRSPASSPPNSEDMGRKTA